MNDLVCKDALVMPSSTGSALAGFSFSEINLAFSCSYSLLVDLLADQEGRIAGIGVLTFCSI